jgi:hypothetical protein
MLLTANLLQVVFLKVYKEYPADEISDFIKTDAGVSSRNEEVSSEADLSGADLSVS